MCIRLPWQRCCVPRSISDSIHPHVPCLHYFASYPFVNPNNVRINPHLANARPQLQVKSNYAWCSKIVTYLRFIINMWFSSVCFTYLFFILQETKISEWNFYVWYRNLKWVYQSSNTSSMFLDFPIGGGFGE